MAVPAAGVFTASQLLKLQVRMNDLWGDNQVNPDYLAEADIVPALMAEDTAKLDALQDPNKTNTVKLIWINAEGVTDAAVGDDCAITGAELATDSQDYVIDLFRTASFSVKEIKSRTDQNTLGEQIAAGMLACDKSLAEWFAAQCVAKLETFKSTANLYTDPVDAAAWTFLVDETTIPENQWDTGLLTKLSLSARKNKQINPFILSGEALWYTTEEATNNAGNAEGSGDDVRNKRYFRKHFDTITIDAELSPVFKAYVIARGAVSIQSKTHYGPVPTLYHNPWQQRYSVPSKNMPGINYEVTYSQSCTSSETTHVFQFKLNAGIFNNPTGILEGARTGVQAYIRPGV